MEIVGFGWLLLFYFCNRCLKILVWNSVISCEELCDVSCSSSTPTTTTTYCCCYYNFYVVVSSLVAGIQCYLTHATLLAIRYYLFSVAFKDWDYHPWFSNFIPWPWGSARFWKKQCWKMEDVLTIKNVLCCCGVIANFRIPHFKCSAGHKGYLWQLISFLLFLPIFHSILKVCYFNLTLTDFEPKGK